MSSNPVSHHPAALNLVETLLNSELQDVLNSCASTGIVLSQLDLGNSAIFVGAPWDQGSPFKTIGSVERAPANPLEKLPFPF